MNRSPCPYPTGYLFQVEMCALGYRYRHNSRKYGRESKGLMLARESLKCQLTGVATDKIVIKP